MKSKNTTSEINKNLDDDLQIFHHHIDEDLLIEQIEKTKLAIDQKIDHLEKRKTVLFHFKYYYKTYLKVAAVLVFAGITAVFMLQKNGFMKNHQPIYTTISSKVKQRKKVILEDGTIVWLNAESKITFDDSFNKKLRQISLEGEAFFEVKRNVEKPFIVKVGNLETKVLGTKFNIQAHRSNKIVDVALLEGKIEVSINKNQKTVLLPNQSICFDKQLNSLSPVLEENTERYAAWHNGDLIFDHTPLKMALNNLEKNFDVKIKVSNPSLNQIKISGKFSLTESPESIITSICKLIDARYKVQNNVILISEIQNNN